MTDVASGFSRTSAMTDVASGFSRTYADGNSRARAHSFFADR